MSDQSTLLAQPLLLRPPTLSHPKAFQDSGDAASKKGDRIWIAEMYGYVFGAAKAGLWHKWGDEFMLYPGYTPTGARPAVVEQ